ncbi:PREDICTED: RING finger protein 10 isoform X2 [Tarenaya hassleriana]|uniref:RING finger protein 10 isoform X2 n=1 Tax=Tarenaya hassleriana TaxID=28532 RepID=UPI00053C145F|nr:PREDICTED: RING finger protein 10 isoform X2 [Tarenaya hassleriana]
MSILSPPQSEGPKSSFSSPDPSLNPVSEYGSASSSPSRISSEIGSLGLAGPPSPSAFSFGSPGEDIRGSSKEVTGIGTGMETFSRQGADRHHDHPRSDGRRNRSRGRTHGFSRGQHNTGPSNSPTSASRHNPTGRRANTISGNHLLNFHYDPISSPQTRAPPQPQRRPYKRRPYNKDLFLQANYKFVVLDTGDHSPESMDPDKMLQWDDIICVRYSTPSPVQCPICLEYPLCPQITSCGHIFCFPCILQYLLMGVDDHKIECFKRCPLCFVMVSPKDLYTLYIENVKQYSVGDVIEFVLLTRKKESFAPTRKAEDDVQVSLSNCENGIYDPFSKFTFTTDVDLSVRQAVSELDGWIARADSGLVDDLEKLPYVSAALEHLEQRKKYWNEHRLSNFSKPSTKARNQMQSVSPANVSQVGNHVPVQGHGTTASCSNKLNKSSVEKSDGESSLDKSGDDGDHRIEDREILLSSSCNGNKGLLMHQNVAGDPKDRDSYNFYQSVDGQHIVLHSLNMKCLIHHYGSYDLLPPRVRGKILELETVTQSEGMRRRYRFLSHFSLTTTFLICEIDMRESLPPNAFAPFLDEIKKREKQRKDRARKERKEKVKAEVAAAAELAPLVTSFGQSSRNDFPPFSLDDFEALGNAAPVSSSPPNTGERSSFSNVTRLGFAAGHDSPGLINLPTSIQNNSIQVANTVIGSRNPGVMSFASAISRTPVTETVKEAGKRGKKPARVLLSTSSVRRY